MYRTTVSKLLSVVAVFFWATTLVAGPKYKTISVENGAKIVGRIVFDGSPPTLMLPATKDAETCHVSKETPSPRLVVGKDRGVKNTVVFLTKVKQGKAFGKDEALLDQKACVFAPHILTVPVRQKLRIRNSDTVLHNVHGYLGKADVFNIAMPKKDQVIEKKMRRAGTIALQCDAGHTWMSGYIFVIEHPYYTVTGDDGTFELTNVPPGKYTLRVWHEGWTQKGGKYTDIQADVQVDLAPKSTTELEFALTPDERLAPSKPS